MTEADYMLPKLCDMSVSATALSVQAFLGGKLVQASRIWHSLCKAFYCLHAIKLCNNIFECDNPGLTYAWSELVHHA